MYEAKDYSGLIGIDGFSDDALNTHFKLYQGYVANVNKVLDQLAEMDVGSYSYAELKRRFGWEFNGMRLHEYYFGSLVAGGAGLEQDASLYKKIKEDFGSYEKWEKDFKAMSAMRGIGWAILYFDKCGGRLLNVWVGEHDCGHPAGCKPLFALDVFEHAFMLDYGTARGDYIEAFFKALNWEKVSERFEKVVGCCKGK